MRQVKTSWTRLFFFDGHFVVDCPTFLILTYLQPPVYLISRLDMKRKRFDETLDAINVKKKKFNECFM